MCNLFDLFYSQVAGTNCISRSWTKALYLQLSRGAGSSWQATEYDYNNKSKSNSFQLEVKIGFLPATVWHDHLSTANRIWKSKNLKLLLSWARLCPTLHLTLGSSLPIKFLSGTFPYASGPLHMVNALKGCKFPGAAAVCVCVCLGVTEGGGLAWHLRKRRSKWLLREAEEELEGESVFGDLLLSIAELCDLSSVIWKIGCPSSPAPALAFGDSNIKWRMAKIFLS